MNVTYIKKKMNNRNYNIWNPKTCSCENLLFISDPIVRSDTFQYQSKENIFHLSMLQICSKGLANHPLQTPKYLLTS